MSEGESCCQKPERLAGGPQDCSPEQIRICHGDADEHPCLCAEDAPTSNNATAQGNRVDHGGKKVLYNEIRCEAVEVRTDSGVCPGLAKTERGEVFLLGARTPEGKGICCQALGAISPMKLAMALTSEMSWETTGYFDVTCPHGAVTYRLSRSTGSN